jgi:hypothetical protein
MRTTLWAIASIFAIYNAIHSALDRDTRSFLGWVSAASAEVMMLTTQQI